MESIGDLRGGVAVITGAASGLGLELARRAAREGMVLVLADLQAQALASAAAELREFGAEVLEVQVDVSRPEQVEALAQATRQRCAAPQLLFNNAGIAAGGLVWENSVDDWQRVLGVNLMGVVNGLRSFVPGMLDAARRDPAYRGHIVNTASMAGLLNAPVMGIYNASKHAVVAVSESLYQDLALLTDQVGASVLCPFYVPTGIARSGNAASGPATRSQQVAQAMLERAVDRGSVSAAQVADTVFEAVAARRFYIFSHPRGLGLVQTRADDIMKGRNPGDPFADRPELGEKLRAQLRAVG